MHRLQTAWKGFLDLLFPRTCIHCEALVESKDCFQFICQRCAEDFHWIHYPCCQRCAYPFFGRLAGEKDCPQCSGLNPAFDRGRALFFMKGVGKKLVHRLKYSKNAFVLKDLEPLFTLQAFTLSFLESSTLVPVPLHPRRYRARGFNQSFLIAKALAAMHSSIKVETLLVKTRNTLSQTELNREARQKNVKNSFDLSPRIAITPHIRYVIVDDVFTTGATLNACSQVLKKAGAKQVDIFVLGRS